MKKLLIALILIPALAFGATTAQQVEFLLSQVRADGIALSGGLVYFYSPGTAIAKTIYSNRTKTSVAANPYTLDTNATAQLYGDGLYRIVIKNAAGVTKYDRDNVYIYNPDTTSATFDNVFTVSATQPSPVQPAGGIWADTTGNNVWLSNGSTYATLTGNADTVDTFHASKTAGLADTIPVRKSTGSIAFGNMSSLTWNGRTASATPGANVIPVGDGGGRIAWGAKPAFRGALVYNSGSTAATAGAPFTSEAYDTDNIHDNVTNPSRLTVPSGVTKVRLSGQLYSVTGAMTLLYAAIKKNGAVFAGNPFHMVSLTTAELAYTTLPAPSPVVPVTAGDYFELYAGNGSTADATGTYSWFAMEVIE